MMLQSVALIACTLYLIYWAVLAIWAFYFHPLCRYPGSHVAVLWNSWYEWYWNYYQNGRLLFEIERLHRVHGPVIRIGVNDLHISDPDVYQDMTRTDSKFTKDPHFYQFISFPGTSIGETDPAKNRIRRKVLTPALSGTRLQELAVPIQQKAQQLLRRLDQAAEAKRPVSVNAAANAFTMDIISRIVLGQDMGCVAEPSFRNEFIDYLHAAFDVGWTATAFPLISSLALLIAESTTISIFPIPLVDFKKRCLNITKKYFAKFVHSNADGNVNEPIHESIMFNSTSRDQRSPVIDMLMDPRSANGQHVVPSLDSLNDELIMLLTAGNDTTSNSIIMGIFQICRNPVVYQTLVSELENFCPRIEDEISYQDAKRMPYLTATIKEILRFAHPLPGRLPRVVPAQGYPLYGHVLPAGTVIHTSAYILNRHPLTWDQPNSFDPSRWLGDDTALLERRLATFNRGARQCLGKDLAWCELWVLLANLFRRFHITPYETTAKDMEWSDLILTVFRGEFRVIVEKRTA